MEKELKLKKESKLKKVLKFKFNVVGTLGLTIVFIIGFYALSYFAKTLIFDATIVKTPQLTLDQKVDILSQKIDTIGNMLLCGQFKDENGKDVLITCNQVIVQTFNKIK